MIHATNFFIAPLRCTNWTFVRRLPRSRPRSIRTTTADFESLGNDEQQSRVGDIASESDDRRGYRDSVRVTEAITDGVQQGDRPSRRSRNSTDVQKILEQTRSDRTLSETAEPEFPSDVADYYKSKYKRYNDWVRDQSKHSYRPRVDPAETAIVLFPGQGSQFVGMGRNLLEYPNVEEVYSKASDVLGYDLLSLCLNGPRDKLDKTVHCQPAVFVTSLAAVEKLKEDNPAAIENCITAAGYSVGEYTALVFAGALSFEDGLRLVKIRAEAMQKASELRSGGMMTVFLRPDAKVNFACHAARRYCTQELHMEDVVCDVSNFLYPGCKIIAGNTEALKFIEQNAREFGITRVRPMPVSGAFHTRLMHPAREPLLNALKTVNVQDPIIPVHSNVNSYKYKSRGTITRLLAQQLYKPVMWEQTMHVIYSRPLGEGFPRTYEVGPGQQLGAVLRQVNKKAYEQYKSISV